MSTALDELRASIARRARREWPQPVEGTPDCRPSTPPEAVEEIIARESAIKGEDPATHPMRSWWHCAACRTWHPAAVLRSPEGGR